MSSLYTNLSEIYEGMYQTFINYEEEFNFYSAILKKHHCQSVLEAGCGTGNLAHRFIAHQFDYIGLDLSDEMLRIARENNPTTEFVKGDMRSFNLTKPVQSCLITGRSVSYLVSDKDVEDAFLCFYKNLTEPGIFCFDFIDASKFIPSIRNGKTVVHEAIVKNKKYKRESFWNRNSSQNGVFDWQSVFYELQTDDSLIKIGEDNSTIRTFYENEVVGFLQRRGFHVKEIIPRPSYAFDTLVIVAEKNIDLDLSFNGHLPERKLV